MINFLWEGDSKLAPFNLCLISFVEEFLIRDPLVLVGKLFVWVVLAATQVEPNTLL